MRGLGAVALGALGVAFCASAQAMGEPGAYIEAAVVPAETRITKTEPPVGGAVVRWKAARGEREPALVVVRSSSDALLTARASALVSRSGAVIPASAVQLSQVTWVFRDGEELPDLLEPWSAPVPARPGENVLVWVEVAVPRGAAPGTYHGELSLQSAGASRELPIELQVLPFALPRKPGLATSFGVGARSGAVGPFARAALRERVTLRVVDPPPFWVTPLEGTLHLDFSAFDRGLGLLLDDASTRPSSIEIAVPASVPLPRKLEYLLAVKRHLAARGCADLLVNFGEEGTLLGGVQGPGDLPGIALVALGGDAPRAAPFWWRVGQSANARTRVGALDSDASLSLARGEWLAENAPGARVRSLGWAAFQAGAVGLYTQEPLALLYEAEDGTPRESVRLKLLRQGLEDYDLLQVAAKVDPAQAHAIAASVLGADGGPASRTPDFEAARARLLSVATSHHSSARMLHLR